MLADIPESWLWETGSKFLKLFGGGKGIPRKFPFNPILPLVESGSSEGRCQTPFLLRFISRHTPCFWEPRLPHSWEHQRLSPGWVLSGLDKILVTGLGPCSLLLIMKILPPAESEEVHVSLTPAPVLPCPPRLEQPFKPSSDPVVPLLTISQWLQLGYRPEISNVSDMLWFRPTPLAFPQTLKCVAWCPLTLGPSKCSSLFWESPPGPLFPSTSLTTLLRSPLSHLSPETSAGSPDQISPIFHPWPLEPLPWLYLWFPFTWILPLQILAIQRRYPTVSDVYFWR